VYKNELPKAAQLEIMNLSFEIGILILSPDAIVEGTFGKGKIKRLLQKLISENIIEIIIKVFIFEYIKLVKVVFFMYVLLYLLFYCLI